MRGHGNHLSDTEVADLVRAFKQGATIPELAKQFDISERNALRRTEHLRGVVAVRHSARKGYYVKQLCLANGCLTEVKARGFCAEHAPAPTTNPALMGGRA